MAVIPRFAPLQQAARRLRRSPGYTASVIAVLALCIGAVTAIFSVVYGVLLKPYGFEQRGKLIVWHETVREWSQTWPVVPVNYRHFENLAAHAHVLESAAVLQPGSVAIRIGAEHPQVLPDLQISAEFFKVLGVKPVLGQGFQPAGYKQNGDRAVILSWAAWQRYFAGNPSAIGKSLQVEGAPYTVVGVLPATFHFSPIPLVPGAPTVSGKAYQIYTPLTPSFGERTANTNDLTSSLSPGCARGYRLLPDKQSWTPLRSHSGRRSSTHSRRRRRPAIRASNHRRHQSIASLSAARSQRCPAHRLHQSCESPACAFGRHQWRASTACRARRFP